MAYNPPTVLFDEKKIDAIFAPFDQCRLPGAAVGIAIHGTPAYRRGFGVANMELPILLSTNIRMRIASISKHFTALAYMLLCEDGIADIDDPIGKYLPELHRSTHKVTMRQLMGNIGGLHDAYDICHQFSGTAYPATSAELLSFYGDLD
jgi:D-aminopeptidase